VPKFHYETRSFSRVVSNTDLNDNDLELIIVNGINYVVKDPKKVNKSDF
jgi:coiled-coil and C2 domain-containing protein 1